jgi:hypothetical protein
MVNFLNGPVLLQIAPGYQGFEASIWRKCIEFIATLYHLIAKSTSLQCPSRAPGQLFIAAKLQLI